MERVTHELYEWLQSHDIDPDKVSLVLHFKDATAKYEVQQLIKQDLDLDYSFLGSFRVFKLNGISISLAAEK